MQSPQQTESHEVGDGEEARRGDETGVLCGLDEERPAFKEELRAFVFDSRGQLIDSAPVRDGKVEVSLSSGGLGRSRVFLVPLDEKAQGQRLTVSLLERLARTNRYSRVPTVPSTAQIPGIIIDRWPFCACWVRGHVVRSSDNRAVCNARVHICEVDRFRGSSPASRPRHLSSAGRSARHPSLPDSTPGPLPGSRPGSARWPATRAGARSGAACARVVPLH